jgi:hypothetical protein
MCKASQDASRRSPPPGQGEGIPFCPGLSQCHGNPWAAIIELLLEVIDGGIIPIIENKKTNYVTHL